MFVIAYYRRMRTACVWLIFAVVAIVTTVLCTDLFLGTCMGVMAMAVFAWLTPEPSELKKEEQRRLDRREKQLKEKYSWTLVAVDPWEEVRM